MAKLKRYEAKIVVYSEKASLMKQTKKQQSTETVSVIAGSYLEARRKVLAVTWRKQSFVKRFINITASDWY
jgi:hypothetical protein